MSTHLHTAHTFEPLSRPVASHLPSQSASTGALSGGQALDRHTQSRMSAQFGHDFSSVRIHTDSRAEESAQAMGANAFASGNDITFAPGKYLPGSRDTERLLAHELTHVVQQAKGGTGDPTRMSSRADASEREADALAGDVAAGQSVEVQAAPDAAVARQSYDMFHPGTCPAKEPLDMTANPSLWNPASGVQPAMGPAMGPIGSVGDAPPGSSTVWDVTTDNTLGMFTSMMEEGVKASRFARFGGPLSVFNKFAGPLGMISNADSLGDDIRDGHFGDAALDGAALTGATIGTASTLGLIGTASALNPVGVAAGTFAGAYAGSSRVLGAANNFAAEHDLMGGGRTTTEASGDAGQWVDEKVHGLTDWIPGIGHGLGSLVGGPLGAVTAMGSGVGTEIYTGGRAAASGIAHGAGWLKDKIFGEDVDVDMADMNKAQEALNQTMDARDMDDERARLYGSGNQVAHEEMPPLSPQTQR